MIADYFMSEAELEEAGNSKLDLWVVEELLNNDGDSDSDSPMSPELENVLNQVRELLLGGTEMTLEEFRQYVDEHTEGRLYV